MATVVPAIPYSPSDYTMSGLGSVLDDLADLNDISDEVALAAARVKAEGQAAVVLSTLKAGYATALGVAYAVIGAFNRNNVIAALQKDGTYITKLEGTYLRWARAGKRDDGSSYSWEMWFGFAKDIADDIVYQTKVNFSGFYNAGIALKDTGKEIAVLAYRVAQKLKEGVETGLATPWWVYGLVGLAAVGVVYAPQISSALRHYRKK